MLKDSHCLRTGLVAARGSTESSCLGTASTKWNAKALVWGRFGDLLAFPILIIWKTLYYLLEDGNEETTNDLIERNRNMETIRDGICLFCRKRALESWSSHGRHFDYYYCNCEGQRNLNAALEPARQNLARIKREEEEDELKAEESRLKKRLKQLKQIING